MNSRIYEKLEQAIAQPEELNPIEVLREGGSVFLTHWKSYFFFALISGVAIRLTAVLYGLLLSMLSFSGLLVFLGAIGGLVLFLWVMASLHAGFFTYTRAVRDPNITPTFSHFSEGFSESRTYMAIFFMQGLLSVGVAMLFGLVYMLMNGGDYLYNLQNLVEAASSAGSLSLSSIIFSIFLEYWVIIIPLVALTVVLMLSFPLATGYYLNSTESIRYSIMLSLRRIGPMFLVWLPLALLGYVTSIIGTEITLTLDLYDPISIHVIQILTGSLIAGFGPVVYYVLTERILGDADHSMDNLINEIGDDEE